MSNGEYVLTEDTGAIFKQLYGRVSEDDDSKYLDRLENIFSESTIKSTVRVFSESEIEASLENAVTSLLEDDPYAICLILDRFLCRSISSDPKYKERIKRISITRSYDGQKISRPGQPVIDQQINEIAESINQEDNAAALYLVDDGFFTGGTIEDIKDRLELVGLNVKGALGFLRSNDIEVSGEIVINAKPISQLDEWVDIRDLGIFGGKINKKGESGRAASAVPYIAPWADGRNASLDMLPDFLDVSSKILNSQIEMLTSYEENFGPLTVRDMVLAGFAIPTNVEKSIPITINTNVIDYLRACIELIEREKQRDVLIIDMDGTLYDLLSESERKDYQSSLLRKQVELNALTYINSLNITSDPIEVLNKGLEDTVGISKFLSDQYGATRKDYYNSVWDINPEGKIGANQDLKDKLLAISGGTFGSNEKKLILLTSAPDVWAKKVLDYLGLSDAFEAIYTGEMFVEKQEVMRMLSARYNVSNMTSIGDQLYTDIIPAQELGMETRLITSAADTASVLEELS